VTNGITPARRCLLAIYLPDDCIIKVCYRNEPLINNYIAITIEIRELKSSRQGNNTTAALCQSNQSQADSLAQSMFTDIYTDHVTTIK